MQLQIIEIALAYSLKNIHRQQFYKSKTKTMDNPNKKKADGKRISQQPHEKTYQKSKASKKTATTSKSKSKVAK